MYAPSNHHWGRRRTVRDENFYGNQSYYGNTGPAVYPSEETPGDGQNSWDTYKDPGHDWEKVALVQVQEEKLAQETESIRNEWTPAATVLSVQQENDANQTSEGPVARKEGMSNSPQQLKDDANERELPITNTPPATFPTGNNSGERQSAWDRAINNVLASHEQQKRLRQDLDITRVREAFGASPLVDSAQSRSPITMREVVDAQMDSMPSSVHAPVSQPETGLAQSHNSPNINLRQETGNAQDQWNYPSRFVTPNSKASAEIQNTKKKTSPVFPQQETKSTQNARDSSQSYQKDITAVQKIWDAVPTNANEESVRPSWDDIVAVEVNDQTHWDTPIKEVNKAASTSTWYILSRDIEQVAPTPTWDTSSEIIKQAVPTSTWDTPSTSVVKPSSGTVNGWGDAITDNSKGQEKEGGEDFNHWNTPQTAEKSSITGQSHLEQAGTSRSSGYGFAPRGDNKIRNTRHQVKRLQSYSRNPNENNRFSAFGSGDARRYPKTQADRDAPPTRQHHNESNYPVRIDMPQGREIRTSNFGQSARSPQQTRQASSTQRQNVLSPQMHQSPNYGKHMNGQQQQAQAGSYQRQPVFSPEIYQPQANSQFFQNGKGFQPLQSPPEQQPRSSFMHNVRDTPVQPSPPSTPFFTQEEPNAALTRNAPNMLDTIPTPQQHMQPDDDTESPDWMITDNGHHYVRSISHFTPRTYLPPPPTASPLTVASHPIAGIGTVHLSVRRSPLDRELHTLVLKNVLHIPTAPCNGFDPGLLGQQCTEQDGVVQGTARRGKEVWYAEIWCGSPRLVVLGTGGSGRSLLEGKGAWWMGSMYPTDAEVEVLDEWMGLLAK